MHRIIPDRDNDFDDRIRERMERQQEPVVRLTDEEIARRIAAAQAAKPPSTRRRTVGHVIRKMLSVR
jgi:hypothetical protein